MIYKAAVRRAFLSLLIVVCIFNSVLLFLSIDLGIIILTPRRITLLFSCVLCFLLLLFRIQRYSFTVLIREKKMSVALFSFLCFWAIIGIIWLFRGELHSDIAGTEVMGIIELCMFSFCFLILLKEKDDLRFCKRIFLVCGLVLAFMADVEIVIGAFVKNTAGDIPIYEKISLGRTLFPPSAVFVNTNDLASFLLLCLVIEFNDILRRDTPILKAEDWIVILILLLPTAVIDSTIFQIALTCQVFLLLVILLRLFRGNRRSVCRTAAGLPAALAIYLFPFKSLVFWISRQLNSLYYAGVIRRYLDNPQLIEDPNNLAHMDTLLTQIDAAKNGYGTIHIRLWLGKACLDQFLQHPLWGVGPGEFRYFILERP